MKDVSKLSRVYRDLKYIIYYYDIEHPRKHGPIYVELHSYAISIQGIGTTWWFYSNNRLPILENMLDLFYANKDQEYG